MASPFRTFNLNVAGGLGIFSGGILLWILYHGPTASQIGAGSLTTARGVSVTDTRASNKTCVTASDFSTVAILTNNQPCVDYVGLNVEGSATNVLLQSQALGTAPWTAGGLVVAAPTVTNNTTDVLAPDGTQTATKIVYPQVIGGGAKSGVSQGAGVTAALWTYSIWLRTLSGTASLYFATTPDGVTYSTATATANTTWRRFTGSGTLTAATWNWELGVDLRDGSESTQPAQTVYAWGAQAESPSANFISSYIATTGTTATRAADDVRVANPLSGGNPTSWSIAATVTPLFLSGTQGVMSFGTSYAAANTANMRITGGGSVNCDVYDSTGTGKTLISNATISAGAHRLACQNVNGTVTILVDGAAVAATSGGTGTGLIATQPATAILGQIQTGGTNPLWGRLTNICIAQTATGCK